MGFRGIQALVDAEQERKKRGFEPASLSDEEKLDLCRSLLAEFGVTKVIAREGELIHACVLPFGQHKDQGRNPTASLNYKKLTYRCLGSCDAGGGLLWFIGLCRGTSGTEARKWLNKEAGFGGEEQSLAKLLAYFDSVYSKERAVPEPIPRMSPRVLEPWLLIHPYLTEVRGIPEPNLVRFRVGYGHFQIRFGQGLIESDRIVIPHFWKGDLVGWQSRRLGDDGSPKYVSSPDFPRDQTIFNYDPKATPVVVEAPLSAITQAHLGHVEATFGASVTDRQIKLLSLHREIILFFDNDEAGWKATHHVAKALEPYSVVRVVENPWTGDAGDLPSNEVERLIDAAVPYPLWRPPFQPIRYADGART